MSTKYQLQKKHWAAFQAWKAERNPQRAELERKSGYDTKHAMHLIRLMRMGLEVVTSGDLRVRRDDALELIAIREGGLSYEQLLAAANELNEAIRQATPQASLPADVDRTRVDDLFVDIIYEVENLAG